MSKTSSLFTQSPQGCPAGYGFVQGGDKNSDDQTQAGVNVLADAGGISYGDYLQLDKILSAQEPQSKIYGEKILLETYFLSIIWLQVLRCMMNIFS